MFLSITKTIICFDDIERLGKDLEIRDVLGLASSLKEQKNCKVCLILNDEALEAGTKQFLTYFEKVIDTSLKFTPSPQECVDIALSTATDTGRLLAENCVTLGISNIRLIKKLEGYITRIYPLLESYDDAVVKQAVQSIVLLGWSVYEPGRAPSLDYLLKRRTPDLFATQKKEDVSPDEVRWNSLLALYKFTSMDEFDLALLEGVQNGFFDPPRIQKHSGELDRQAKAAKLNNSFADARELYHNSFAEQSGRSIGPHVQRVS